MRERSGLIYDIHTLSTEHLKYFTSAQQWKANDDTMLRFHTAVTLPVLTHFSLCAAIHKDPDESFDPSLFKVPVYFDGSFQLPNLVFTDELLTLSSNESQALATGFQEKVCHILT